MPTILSHPAVPLALGAAFGRRIVSKRLLIAGAVGAMLPDLDVVMFQFGVSYESDWGHRGFSHSLCMAAVYGLVGMLFAERLHVKRVTAFIFLFIAMASHGILDAFTNGGNGIALLWPFSSERYFAPVRPIVVSPIGVERFLTERGLRVLWSELGWVWLPCVSFAFTVYWMRRRVAEK